MHNKNLAELKRYVGSWRQMFGIKEYEFTSGRAKGVKGFDVKTGGGLEFTVVDRTMDITELSYRGQNLSFLSPCGVCAPEYTSEDTNGFLKNFTCGAMMTCGYNTIGAPSVDDGVEYGLHGKLPTLRAEHVGAKIEWDKGVPEMVVYGTISHSWLYSEKIVTQREIRCRYGGKRIDITDSVNNCGFQDEPFFLLYHVNWGYPLVDDNSYVLIPSKGFVAGNSLSETPEEMLAYDKCQPPESNYSERVFFHKMISDQNGDACMALVNPNIDLGIAVYSNTNELPRATQWKYMQEGEYVIGLSPSNATGFGRKYVRESGEMPKIKKDEIKTIHISFEILDGKDEIENITTKIEEMKNRCKFFI